jgi:hypothetical protein
MNDIKTDARNKLGEPLLNMLMFCRLNAMDGLSDRVLEEVVKDYFSKTRYGLKGLIRMGRVMRRELDGCDYPLAGEEDEEDEEDSERHHYSWEL